MKFDSLGLHEDLLRGINDAGFKRCTPVQEQSLPESLEGKDIISQSQTGSGKTAVFLITAYTRLLKCTIKSSGKPKVLIMVPTRELAHQVDQDAKKLGKYLPFRSVTIYGGVGYDKQVSALKEGVDIVVATPGRMIDLYKSKNLSFSSIEMFVIDEADRMFDMGFAPDVRYIANRLPKDRARQTMLFSATIDSNVRRLAAQYMKPDLITIEVEPEQITVDSIDQKICYVSNEEKLPVLMALLNRPDVLRVIVFTNMKRTAEMLEWKLKENSFPAKVLTGDVSQAKRQRIMDSMKSGKVRILIATDVAARGIHIDGVSHVINYDLPEDAASYVHRVGRTARAGKSGKAYSLVCEDHALNLPEIEKYIEHKIESEWIEDAEIIEDKAGAFVERRQQRKSFAKSSMPKRSQGTQRRKTSPAAKKSNSRKPQDSSITAKKEQRRNPVRQTKKTDLKPGDGKKREKPRATSEERLAYYKKKYGEDFRPKDENATAKSENNDSKGLQNREGALKRFLSLFKGND
ncbi:MAG: DEAD/DEAH box helicase [Thermodesulfobacteriota bacterium]